MMTGSGSGSKALREVLADLVAPWSHKHAADVCGKCVAVCPAPGVRFPDPAG